MLGGVTGKGFMPGQSGNPGGRVKAPKLDVLLAEYGQRPIYGGRTVMQQFAEVAWTKALAGDVQWARLVCDRLWGPVASIPPQLDNDLRAALVNKALNDVIAEQIRYTAEQAIEGDPPRDDDE